MGFKYEKEKTGATPYIIIDEDSNYVRFEGKSFSEDASEFFCEVVEWLDEYLKTDFKELVFDCELRYFNSTTAKFLYGMLKNMDKAACGGKEITVNWIADKSNDVNIEIAEDFSEGLDYLNFKLILK